MCVKKYDVITANLRHSHKPTLSDGGKSRRLYNILLCEHILVNYIV